MFDFPKWKAWLEARAIELQRDGLKIKFSAGPDVSQKPGMSLGIQGKNATGLFQNWHTGETDYTIHAPSDGPKASYRWGLIATDGTFEAVFREFVAEFNRLEAADKADELWCQRAAASIVDELLMAKLIPREQADWARKIVGQDLFIQLVSGQRPQYINPAKSPVPLR